jgi:uncharacterized protein YqgQ
MQSLDFVLVVVPLTSIIATLTGLIYYFARREEFDKHKRAVAIQKFLGVRSKQQALMRNELEKVTSLYENGTIDKNTFERLQNVLFMTQEKLRDEASTLFNEKDGVFKKIEELPLEKLLLEPELDESLEPETNHEEQEICEVKPKKIAKAKTRKKRTVKRKKDEKLKNGGKKELQMGIVIEDKAFVKA